MQAFFGNQAAVHPHYSLGQKPDNLSPEILPRIHETRFMKFLKLMELPAFIQIIQKIVLTSDQLILFINTDKGKII